MTPTRPTVAPPPGDLRRYIRGVAGALGILSMRIIRAWRGPVSDRLALTPALMMGSCAGDLARMERAGWQRHHAPFRLARGRKPILGLRGLPARSA